MISSANPRIHALTAYFLSNYVGDFGYPQNGAALMHIERPVGLKFEAIHKNPRDVSRKTLSAPVPSGTISPSDKANFPMTQASESIYDCSDPRMIIRVDAVDVDIVVVVHCRYDGDFFRKRSNRFRRVR